MRIREYFKLLMPQKRLSRSLRILIFVNTGMVFIVGIFAPFYAVFVQKIGGNIALAGLSWAIFSIVAGVLTLLFSRWQLKIKEQELLLALGYFIRGIAFLSYAFLGNTTQLIFTQILWGIGVALGAPAFDSLYSSHTSREESIVQWGQWEGIAAIATGLAALVGGILIQIAGYLIVFIGMSFLSFILGIYVWRLPRDVL